MRPSIILRAAHQRTPMIKFLGRRQVPESIDHTPKAHPASPSQSLPDSFASYREKATQHGPLNGNSTSPSSVTTRSSTQSTVTYGAIGGKTGRSLGSVQPKVGEYFDRNELPKRFQRLEWTEAEIEAVSSGGASMWN